MNLEEEIQFLAREVMGETLTPSRDAGPVLELLKQGGGPFSVTLDGPAGRQSLVLHGWEDGSLSYYDPDGGGYFLVEEGEFVDWFSARNALVLLPH